jgi:hypothetical protein
LAAVLGKTCGSQFSVVSSQLSVFSKTLAAVLVSPSVRLKINFLVVAWKGCIFVRLAFTG